LPLRFRSILFDEFEISTVIEGPAVPDFFADLNLDQIIASATAGRDEYNLKPFFYTPLKCIETINYRYEILRDLENRVLFGHVGSFAQMMRAMRDHLAQADKLDYKYQKQRWFLEAADIYCCAVSSLTRVLTCADLRSRGFLACRDYLTSYTKSAEFAQLLAETEKLKEDLSGIRYCLHIRGNCIKVSRYDSEPDYGADVLHTFEKFQQGAVKEYRFDFHSWPSMNHVEAAVLELVAQLHSDIFSSLDQYNNRHQNYLDDTIRVFDREIQFYVACIEHIERFKPSGLPFCYPIVTDQSKEVYGHEVYDLALAEKLICENAPMVTNDFYLKNPERIFVVTGPNQGGKTTFARTFEDLRNLSSKLEDDLLRIHRILERATSNSILIMNESFVSTTLNDALFLSKQIIQRIIQLDMLCLSVTFLDELASLSETTVSMVSTLDPQNQALRTFKVVRKPADGLAHAVALAEKYRLTYESVKERIRS
jgi:DNA mismatch repair protein MutS